MQNQFDAQALTIVELEERFEMTAAAVDTNKCDNNTVKVEVPVLKSA
jgi:hypothetical protein